MIVDVVCGALKSEETRRVAKQAATPEVQFALGLIVPSDASKAFPGEGPRIDSEE